MKNSPLLFVAIFCMIATSTHVHAQVRDAQVWENVSLDFKLNKKTVINFNHEGRFVENASWFGLAYADLGICRKLGKKFKAGANYVFAYKRTYKEESLRHQYYAYLNFKQELFKNTSISWRTMYQIQYSDIFSSELGKVPATLWRNKLTLKYDPFYYPWNKFSPYLATEFHYNLDAHDNSGLQFNRTRAFVGVYYNINKTTSIEAYFLNEYNYNIKRPTINYIYGVGFSRTIL